MAVARSLFLLFLPVVARRPGLDASLPSLALNREIDLIGGPEEASTMVELLPPLAPPLPETPVDDRNVDNEDAVRSRGQEEIKRASLLGVDTAAAVHVHASADSSSRRHSSPPLVETPVADRNIDDKDVVRGRDNASAASMTSAMVELVPPLLETPGADRNIDSKEVLRGRDPKVRSTSLLDADSAAATDYKVLAAILTDTNSSASTGVDASADSMTNTQPSASTGIDASADSLTNTESSASSGIRASADSMTNITSSASTEVNSLETRRGEVAERELFSAFMEADQDKSQTLTFDEAMGALSDGKGLQGEDRERLQSLFNKSDSNKDGHVGMDEIDSFVDGVYNEFEDEVHRDLADDVDGIPAHEKEAHYDQDIAALHAKAEYVIDRISALQTDEEVDEEVDEDGEEEVDEEVDEPEDEEEDDQIPNDELFVSEQEEVDEPEDEEEDDQMPNVALFEQDEDAEEEEEEDYQ